MSRPQVIADFKLNSSGVKKGVQEVDKQFKGLGSSMRRSVTSGLRTSMTAGAGAIGAVVGATVTKSLTAGLQQAFSIENSEIAMKSMLGSLEKAREAVAMIGEEARQNPMFSKEQLAATAQALVGFADKSTEKLHQLVEQAQLLYTLKPSAGVIGAAEALRDAIGGETERLKEYGFTGKELSSMKQAAGGGDLTPFIAKALEQKGITEATLRDMAGSRQAQLAAMSNQLTNVGEDFWIAIWPELQPQLQEMTGWLKTNRDDVVAGLEVIAGAVGTLVTLTGKAGGVVDKVSESYAQLASGERELSNIEKGVGSINPAFWLLTRGAQAFGRNNRPQAELGERSEMFENLGKAKRAAKLGDRSIQVKLHLQSGHTGNIPKPMVHS